VLATREAVFQARWQMRYRILATWSGTASVLFTFILWMLFGLDLTASLIVSPIIGVVGFLLVRLSWWLARIRNPGQHIPW
jgi:hypothetical protein